MEIIDAISAIDSLFDSLQESNVVVPRDLRK